jgi:uncharacterized repeat protein (TIGR03843 family)
LSAPLPHDGDLQVVGQLSDASNTAILVRVGGPAAPLALYKPIRGERPLWDFPHGNLACREVAAYLLSEAGGWGVVPPTILRDGPFGPGSVQLWVTSDPVDPAQPDADPAGHDSPGPAPLVLLAEPSRLPPGYLSVAEGATRHGAPIVVAHADTAELAAVAVFDAVLNNTDRKGSHLVRDPAGRVWGIDHGVSLHTQDKLRTVLWGWQGQRLPAEQLEAVGRVSAALGDDSGPLATSLATLLTAAEIRAVRRRADRLLATARFPAPSPDWPALPWPPL